MRLFVALELPDQARAAAAGVIAELKAAGVDVKWVRPENLHLTLKFLGEAPDDAAPSLGDALESALAGLAAPQLGLAGCGAFPRPSSPNVIWLGLAGETRALAELAGAVEDALGPLGFPPEERPFTAHLTLGRVRRGRGSPQAPPAPLARAIAGLAGWQGPAFAGGTVALMQSNLTPAGPIYRPLRRVTLGGALER